MAATIVPAQDGSTISAPFFNANIRAIIASIDALESTLGGTVSDLHGNGVLWGYFTSINNGILTVGPGVAYVSGVRVANELASNFTLPSSAVSYIWLRYHSSESEHVVLSNTAEITYYQNTDTLHITYPEAAEEEETLYQQITDASANGGSYHAISSGDIVIDFVGEGKVQLIYIKGAQGCSASVYHRYKQEDGEWSAWTQDDLANTTVNCSGASAYNNTALLLSGQVGENTERQIKLSVSGGEGQYFYLDAIKHYKPSQVAPSTSSMLLHKIITDHNGTVTSQTDERESLSLSKSEWEELFKTKYRLLSSAIVCTQCFYDPFLTTARLDYENCTAYVDTQQHQVRMGQTAPYELAAGGSMVLEGQGRATTETFSITSTPYQLNYPQIAAGSVLVRSTDLSTVYASGYIVDYDNGTVVYDTAEEGNPITQGQAVRIDYTGISQTTLTTRLTGEEAQNITVQVEEGSTASKTDASRTLLDTNGNESVEISPKSSFSGAEGNSIKVIVENGSNQEDTIAELQLQDGAIEAAPCLEIKAKGSGAAGNAIRVSVAEGGAEKIINGGFELGIGDWLTDDGGVGAWAIDESDCHSGAQSLQADKTSGGGEMVAYRVYNCKAGSTYRASLWFKSAGAFDITGTLSILSGDRAISFGSTQFLGSLNLNQDWSESTIDIDVPATNQQLTFHIKVVGSGQGEVWLDDLSLVLLDSDSFLLTVEDDGADTYLQAVTLESANASASSGTASNAIDEDESTAWIADPSDEDMWWKYEFSTNTYVRAVGIFVEPSDNTDELLVAIDTGDSSENYTELATMSISRGQTVYRINGHINCKYIRVRVIENSAVGISKIGVWSSESSTNPTCPIDSSIIGNLLPSNSFENWETRDTNIQPVGWTCYVNDVADDGQQENTPDNVIDGERSAAVIEDDAGYTYRYDSDTLSGLDTDATYAVNVWVKVGSITAGSEAYAEVVPLDDGSIEQTPVRLLDSDGNDTQLSTGGWKLLAVNYSPEHSRMKLRLVVDGPAHVWWDNSSVHLFRETFDNLTLDEFDPALGWTEGANYAAAAAINTSGTGSSLVTAVDLTSANDFPHSGSTQNPENLSMTYLTGGETVPTTVKITVQKYRYENGQVTETLDYQTVFDNLTLDKSNVPGTGDSDNRDLIETLSNSSGLIDATYLLGDQAEATWENNPVASSGNLSGGATVYDTVNITLRKGSAEAFEAESLLDFYTESGDETISASFTGSWQPTANTMCSGGSMLLGTPGVEGLTAYLFIRGPVMGLDLLYTEGSQYGTVELSLAEIDEVGNIGSFSSIDSRLVVSSIDQSGTGGPQTSTPVLRNLFDEYSNGDPMIYCLKIEPSAPYAGDPINLDAITSYTEKYKETLEDLTYDAQVYTSTSGKHSLLTAINDGNGIVGPSLLVTAQSDATRSHAEDNPNIMAASPISGASGASTIIYSQIITDDDWGTIPQFYLFTEQTTDAYTSINYAYTLNPRDANPTWVPIEPGTLVVTSAEAGQHEIQIKAVLSTSSATSTPVLHDWGIFWGEPSYIPEDMEMLSAAGELTITCRSSGTVRVPVGFNVVDANLNIVSILLVSDTISYGYPYFDHPLGYVYGYGYNELTSTIEGDLGTLYHVDEDTIIEVLPVGYDQSGFTIYYNGPAETEITIEWTANGWL